LAPGVDVKARGGLVVAPASLHESGNRYDWLLGRRPQDAGIGDVPEAWTAALESARRSERRDAGARRPHRKSVIPVGERDVTLFRIGLAMCYRGEHDEAVERELLRVNRALCEIPLLEVDVLRKARSARRSAERNTGGTE